MVVGLVTSPFRVPATVARCDDLHGIQYPGATQGIELGDVRSQGLIDKVRELRRQGRGLIDGAEKLARFELGVPAEIELESPDLTRPLPGPASVAEKMHSISPGS